MTGWYNRKTMSALLATLPKHVLCVLDIYMTAGSELGLWWYFWYVLAGMGKYHDHRPITELEMPAGLGRAPVLHYLDKLSSNSI